VGGIGVAGFLDKDQIKIEPDEEKKGDEGNDGDFRSFCLGG
jgi:hypothetical protein